MFGTCRPSRLTALNVESGEVSVRAFLRHEGAVLRHSAEFEALPHLETYLQTDSQIQEREEMVFDPLERLGVSLVANEDVVLICDLPRPKSEGESPC